MEMVKAAKVKHEIHYQVEYIDDEHRKHLCFVPHYAVSYYRQRFEVVDVQPTMWKLIVNNDENF